MALRTPAERAAYKEGVEAGSLRGVGHAIHLLMDVGCPSHYAEPLHEYIDFWEARNGDLKREPRSLAGKEAKRDGIGPWQTRPGG